MQMNDMSDLEADVRRSFDLLGADPEPWVEPMAGVDETVTIVGAGQNGIATAFALRRKGVRVRVIEAAEEGGEGVWLKRARMQTLRTPKDRPGPELGVPALTFKAWHIAKFGAPAYAELGRAPREMWAEYLAWFRRMVGVEVEFGVRLVDVEPCGTALSLNVESGGRRARITTRKLVLATGQAAGGARNMPAVLGDLPRDVLAHTDDLIDFTTLRGKRIGVLGASASGFDAASTALEQGAACAHVFCRAPDLARGTRYRWADYPGADYFHLLPDAERWRIASLYLERGNHPPATAIARAGAQRDFHLHLGSPWDRASARDGIVTVESAGESFEFDFIIAATGFLHHPRRAPELAALSSHIALWSDRYAPPPEQANDALANYPYLGEALQFQERETGLCMCVENIHVINQSALLSLLRIVGDIKFLGFTAERVAAGVVRDLFLADREAHMRRLASPVIAELTGDEYASLVWRKRR